MKIGILTYHQADNYGAALQVFALQQVMTKLNCECEVINYYSKAIQDQYTYKKFERHANLWNVLKFNINQYLHRKKHKNFELFRENICLSKPYTIENIKDSNLLYDAFITGSDQVWNYNVNKSDFTFLLNFVDDSTKKNSYAASFGVSSIPNELIKEYRTLLSAINHISVREQQGRDLIKNLIDRDCEVVLDPVLLLNMEQWSKFIKEPKDSKYVLIYQLYKSRSLLDFARKLAKKKHCKLVIVSQSLYGAYYGFPRMKNKSNVGPYDFLSLLLGASYIVTNSFHGTAFAITFHKEFYVEYISGGHDVNSRFDSLLRMFNLTERKIIDTKINNIDLRIDYDVVEKLLSKKRKQSLAYLKNMIGFYNE